MTASRPKGGPGHEENIAEHDGAGRDPGAVRERGRSRDEYPVGPGRAGGPVLGTAGPRAGAGGLPSPRTLSASPSRAAWRVAQRVRGRPAEDGRGEMAVRIPQVRGAGEPY